MKENKYTKFSNNIWKDKQLKSNEKLVLIYLISYHNKNLGYAYPTRKQIQDDTGISENTLGKVLNNLIDKGYVSKESYKNERGRNNIYFIHKYLVVRNNNESLSEPPQDDLNDNATNSSSDKSESLTEPTTNELLLSKSKKFDGKLTAEQRDALNTLDTDRLMKAIEKAEETGNHKTYNFKYLMGAYERISSQKEVQKKQAQVNNGYVNNNYPVKTKYHDYGNEHFRKYKEEELEEKLLKVQNSKNKSNKQSQSA